MPREPLLAAAPQAGLRRIGRAPNPLVWPPARQGPGRGRFDDPRNEFRTLYAAEQRLTCFVETLAGFRASLEWLEAARRVPATTNEITVPAGTIPPGWFQTRMIGRLHLGPGQRWLDLRTLGTRVVLRQELAGKIAARQLADFDLGDVICRQRPVTQEIARWAYAAGYHGIAYTSRFGCAYDCWVLFDTAVFTAGLVELIALDDPDLAEVSRLFDLSHSPGTEM